MFVFSITVFATTRTGYYTAGQTKENILARAKIYENDLKTYKYAVIAERIYSPFDYSKTWSYELSGSKTETTVRYQFLEDKILITISDAKFITKYGTSILLTKNDPIEAKSKIYGSMENVFVVGCFNYLQVSENAPQIQAKKPTNTDASAYDFITANYLSADTKQVAKKRSSEFINKVLKTVFKVTFLTDPDADVQQIKYVVEDDKGFTTIIMDYQFRDKDFSIKINSMDYYQKELKIKTVISQKSSSKTASEFYTILKDYFIDKHSNYIAPK